MTYVNHSFPFRMPPPGTIRGQLESVTSQTFVTRRAVFCFTHIASISDQRTCRSTVSLKGSMSPLRILLPVLCLLGLSCTAYAQNLTASTPLANLTIIAQNAQNFTNMTLPSFPCDGTSGLTGGYSTLDLDDAQNDEDLYYIFNEVFNYFYSATANLTDCTFIEVDYSNLTNACSQVQIATISICRSSPCLFRYLLCSCRFSP